MPPAPGWLGRLCVVGVGLIGGSLARALREAGACTEIIGSSRSPEHLARARELGVIDRFETDPARAVRGADVVLVATPVGAMEKVFGAIVDALAPEAIVTDAGSVKVHVIEAARRAFGSAPVRFVPGHPVAGTEHSGVEASFPSLYRGRKVILTPTPDTDAAATAHVRSMWEATGAEVELMSASRHDDVLAATSHLPHMLAFALVDLLAGDPDGDAMFRFAAGGFRDFTRIASSDPVMWRDIALANRGALSERLRGFAAAVGRLTELVEDGRADELEALFRRAKTARDDRLLGAPPGGETRR